MIINHYGETVDSETPTTGVYSGNDVSPWFWDEDSIDPNYGIICPYCGNEGFGGEYVGACSSCGESVSSDDVDYWDAPSLYGSWVKDENGLWDVDRTGEYAAIYNQDANTIQVIFSRYIKRGRLCSPCYPGQADARVSDTVTGDGFAYYALPDELLFD